VLTTYLNDGRRPPRRSAYRNAHAYLAAPYGVYDTADGYLAIAMTNLPTLGKLLGLPELERISDQGDGFRNRDSIKQTIARRLKEQSIEHWLEILNTADIWCAEILDWPTLCDSEAFRQLEMVQTLRDGANIEILTTRLPLRLDGNVLKNEKLAPKVGQHNAVIEEEFGL
jgi:CoA:oxalate CoA-transferase